MPANWRNVDRCRAASFAVAAVFGLVASSAFADVGGTGNPPVFMMTWDASGDQLDPFTYNPSDWAHMPTEYGTWTLGGGPNGQGGALREQTGWRYRGGLTNALWNLTWDCVANEDPFVDATINVTNTSNSTQVFWVLMPLNIVPSLPLGTIMDGDVSAVISDQNFSGAGLLSTAGADPIFQGYIDGAAVPNATLWNAGYSLAAPPFGAANDMDNFDGLIGPAAINQIGIRLRFELSAGDSASVTGIFNVNQIPAPAGLSLLAVFGAVASRRRRR